MWLPKSEPNRLTGMMRFNWFRQQGRKRATNAARAFQKANTAPMKKLVEFRNFEEEYKLGDTITVDHFTEGEFVDVSGTSKGKGFQEWLSDTDFQGSGRRLMDNTTG